MRTTQPPPGVTIDHQHPLSRGLVGFWPFNEGAGSRLADISGKGNHGTITNMDLRSAWVGSPQGGGLSFDGSNDHVNGIALPTITDVTLVAIASLRATASFPMLISHKYADGNFTELRFNAATSDLTMRYNETSFTASGHAATLGRSTFFAGTGQASGIRIYINGLWLGENSSITLAAMDQNWRFGDRATDGGLPFPGTISYIRIYDRALSDQEIHELYASPYAGLMI